MRSRAIPRGLTITPRGELTYVSRAFFAPFNLDRVSRAPNTKLNAFLTIEKEPWTVRFFGRNLTDKRT